jgi:hypothetical protein
VIVASPAALGVNVTEHVEVPTVALATRVHGFGVPRVPAAPVEVKVTEPEGLLAPAPLVSTTVAVHVEAWLIGTDEGAQTTVVEVVRPPLEETDPLPAPLLVEVA